jgi:hypothetical protein
VPLNSYRDVVYPTPIYTPAREQQGFPPRPPLPKRREEGEEAPTIGGGGWKETGLLPYRLSLLCSGQEGKGKANGVQAPLRVRGLVSSFAMKSIECYAGTKVYARHPSSFYFRRSAQLTWLKEGQLRLAIVVVS